jgi:hypothetical protein
MPDSGGDVNPVAQGSIPETETLSLRGHHLLCMLTYAGEAYTLAFGRNMDGWIGQINKTLRRTGVFSLSVVSGRDSFCRPMCPASHCDGQVMPRRDAQALRNITRLVAARGMQSVVSPDLPLRHGSTTLALNRSLIAEMRKAFQTNALRHGVCYGCPHETRCTEVATKGFVDARLELG